jgi:hypothetical protein
VGRALINARKAQGMDSGREMGNVHLTQEQDQVQWTRDATLKFLVKSAYRFSTETPNTSSEISRLWEIKSSTSSASLRVAVTAEQAAYSRRYAEQGMDSGQYVLYVPAGK